MCPTGRSITLPSSFVMLTYLVTLCCSRQPIRRVADYVRQQVGTSCNSDDSMYRGQDYDAHCRRIHPAVPAACNARRVQTYSQLWLAGQLTSLRAARHLRPALGRRRPGARNQRRRGDYRDRCQRPTGKSLSDCPVCGKGDMVCIESFCPAHCRAPTLFSDPRSHYYRSRFHSFKLATRRRLRHRIPAVGPRLGIYLTQIARTTFAAQRVTVDRFIVAPCHGKGVWCRLASRCDNSTPIARPTAERFSTNDFLVTDCGPSCMDRLISTQPQSRTKKPSVL